MTVTIESHPSDREFVPVEPPPSGLRIGEVAAFLDFEGAPVPPKEESGLSVSALKQFSPRGYRFGSERAPR